MNHVQSYPDRYPGQARPLNQQPMFEHGGNIYTVAEELRIHYREIIDFSSNINPLGVPESVSQEIHQSLKDIARYPDPDARALRTAIAERHKVSPESVVCGNGSTELIHLIVRAFQPNRVLINIPTFSEYERALMILQKTHHPVQIDYLPLEEKHNFDIDPDACVQALQASPRYDMMFLCNPNNPTGRLIKKKDVLMIAQAAKALKVYLIVDEAFIDFVPDESVITEVGKNPYLIVLRSMTKFYALPGLRLGCGVLPLQVLNIIKQYKEPWTVNALAQKAGIVALNDTAYKKQTMELIKREKRFLEDNFKKIGINYFDASANFYLLKIADADKIYHNLLSKGVLVRMCSHFKGLGGSYIRVAVKTRKQNMRLIATLNAGIK